MSKDPAILFYTSDFLAQCTSLTMEESIAKNVVRV